MTPCLCCRLASLMVERVLPAICCLLLLAGAGRAGERSGVGPAAGEAGGASPGGGDAGGGDEQDPEVQAEIAALVKDLGEGNADVRKRAEQRLGKIGAPAVPAMVSALGDEAWQVRESAQKVLLQIGRPAVAALRKVAGSKDLEVATRAKAILARILGKGWLGVEIRDPDDDDRRGRDYPKEGGSVVVRVLPGTPAQKAGLAAGDLLYSINGTVLRDTQHLIEVVANTEPGTKAVLVVYSAGRKAEVKLTVGRRPKEQPLE